MSLNISISEHDEQVAFFEEVAWAHRNLWKNKLIYAIPNGGYRNKITAIHLKAEGVVAGIPDIFCAVAKNGYHGLYIEMKKRKGGQLSELQRDAIRHLAYNGYACKVAKGCDEAMQALEAYLKGKFENNPEEWAKKKAKNEAE